jgi:hypothetical protein
MSLHSPSFIPPFRRRSCVCDWGPCPFNLRGFVARQTQCVCNTGRKRFSGRFVGCETGGGSVALRGQSRQTQETDLFHTRNPRSGCGSFLAGARAQNPRFEKSKCGKFERDFFARGRKRALEWRATQSYIAAARGNESRVRGTARPRNREGGRGGGSVERGTPIPTACLTPERCNLRTQRESKDKKRGCGASNVFRRTPLVTASPRRSKQRPGHRPNCRGDAAWWWPSHAQTSERSNEIECASVCIGLRQCFEMHKNGDVPPPNCVRKNLH